MSGKISTHAITKLCRSCRVERQAESFFTSLRSRDGLTNYCRSCLKARTKLCPNCNRRKTLRNFYRSGATWCRECTFARNGLIDAFIPIKRPSAR